MPGFRPVEIVFKKELFGKTIPPESGQEVQHRNARLSTEQVDNFLGETEVHSFTVEYEEDRDWKCQDRILRVYPGDDAIEKSAREFKAMKQLHEIGFPVPHVFLLESDSTALGKPFVIMERISGCSMGDVIHESSEERGRELLTLFCKMFVQLHEIDPEPFIPFAFYSETYEPETLITQTLSRWQKVVCHVLVNLTVTVHMLIAAL